MVCCGGNVGDEILCSADVGQGCEIRLRDVMRLMDPDILM